ncbi:MAG: hypothetical protein OXQ29_26340 [Rhodospirillaceae bacterium]|nr:hypothetical protein [Rhodospirillaceae bacterium]
MVRIRRLGSEFHSPDEIRPGLQLSMQYLADYERWQHYLDDNLAPLYARHSDGANGDKLTGYSYYRNAPKAIWEMNYFRSVVRAFEAAVWSDMPMPIDASEQITAQWMIQGSDLIRQMRKSIEWRVGFGRGVVWTDEQVGSVPLFQTSSPAGYIPLLHPYNRDLVLGHVFLNFWREGERLQETDLANRVTAQIFVTPEAAAQSDGYMQQTNVIRIFEYAGQGSGAFGSLGALLGEVPGRLLGVWTYGDDDSIFGSMERNVFEALMHLSNARSALTRDVRPHQIVPTPVDPRNLDSQGRFVIDPVEPNVYVPVDESSGGQSMFGYVEPPGPATSAAFMELHELAMRQLAYVAMTPPEEFGDNYMSGEPAQAVQLLKHTFLMFVIDARDDISRILSEAWATVGGPSDVRIGWSQAPYVDTDAIDARVIRLLSAGLISRSTGQSMAGLPIEDTGTTGAPTDDNAN